jgi:type II secretory ATPase GspE/PulE/Tfp pilus assembly ATPase PilB-like protein
VCPSCETKYHPSPESLADAGIKDQVGRPFRKGAGCQQCHDSGFQGRLGVYEVMEVTPTLRRFVHDGAAAHELRNVMRRMGAKTLREEGVFLALAGKTSLEEILMVTHNDAEEGEEKKAKPEVSRASIELEEAA